MGVGAERCSQGEESSSPTTPTAALQGSQGEGDSGGGGGCGKQIDLFVIPSYVVSPSLSIPQCNEVNLNRYRSCYLCVVSEQGMSSI